MDQPDHAPPPVDVASVPLSTSALGRGLFGVLKAPRFDLMFFGVQGSRGLRRFLLGRSGGSLRFVGFSAPCSEVGESRLRWD